MSSANREAEEIYFAVYQQLALNAEYMQSTSVKRLLPEVVIAAALGAVFQAVFNSLAHGFFARFGEQAADYVSEKVRNWSAAGKSPEQIVAAIEESLPVIRRSDVNWEEIAGRITPELTRLGLALPVSQKVAIEVCRILRNKSAAS